MTQPGGQLWNQCKWCHLVAKCQTLPEFQRTKNIRSNIRYIVIILAPLCLWQCFITWPTFPNNVYMKYYLSRYILKCQICHMAYMAIYTVNSGKNADNQIKVIDGLSHLSESCLLHFLPLPAEPRLIRQLKLPKKIVKRSLIKISPLLIWSYDKGWISFMPILMQKFNQPDFHPILIFKLKQKDRVKRQSKIVVLTIPHISIEIKLAWTLLQCITES